MNRATVALHSTENGEHLDIFFETASKDEKSLLTYEAGADDRHNLLNGSPVKIVRKEDHRKQYLDFEGEISGNRGKITILWQGNYNPEIDFKNEFFIKIILKYIESS